eukprot:16383-Heterococcus_DN1.PRE.8
MAYRRTALHKHQSSIFSCSCVLLATSQEQQDRANDDSQSKSSGTPDRIIPIWECILKWRQLNSDVTTASTTAPPAATTAEYFSEDDAVDSSSTSGTYVHNMAAYNGLVVVKTAVKAVGQVTFEVHEDTTETTAMIYIHIMLKLQKQFYSTPACHPSCCMPILHSADTIILLLGSSVQSRHRCPIARMHNLCTALSRLLGVRATACSVSEYLQTLYTPHSIELRLLLLLLATTAYAVTALSRNCSWLAQHTTTCIAAIEFCLCYCCCSDNTSNNTGRYW